VCKDLQAPAYDVDLPLSTGLDVGCNHHVEYTAVLCECAHVSLCMRVCGYVHVSVCVCEYVHVPVCEILASV